MILVYELRRECTQLMFKVANGGDCISQMVIDVHCRKMFSQISLDSCTLFWSLTDGSIKSVDLTDWLKGFPFKSSKNTHF